MSLRSLVFVALCASLPAAQAADYDADPSFGSAGWQRLYEPGAGFVDDKGVAFARTADGGYVVVAELTNGGANGGNGKRIGLFRLDRDGHPVTTGFGNAGKVFKDAWLTRVTAMTIDAQGRIIVVGSTPGQGGLADFGVVRFNPDGSDDTSFAGDGGIAFGFDTSIDSADAPTSVLAQADGKIVVAGNVQFASTTSRFGVVRLNVDGSVDSTFGDIDDGHGGRRGADGTFSSGHAAYASQIVRIDDGYFVITGTTVLSDTDSDFAARILTPDGSPWAGFAGSVELAVDEPGPGGTLYDTLTATALASPTTLVLAGTSSGKAAALRVVASKNAVNQYANLTIDASFAGSSNSVLSHRFVGAYENDRVQAAGVRSDGRVVLAGRWTDPGGPQYGMTTRLKADGSADESYGTNGASVITGPTSGSQISYFSEFNSVLFDNNRMVLMGSAADSTTSASDLDVVVTRRVSDLIFFDGFQAH